MDVQLSIHLLGGPPTGWAVFGVSVSGRAIRPMPAIAILPTCLFQFFRRSLVLQTVCNSSHSSDVIAPYIFMGKKRKAL